MDIWTLEASTLDLLIWMQVGAVDQLVISAHHLVEWSYSVFVMPSVNQCHVKMTYTIRKSTTSNMSKLRVCTDWSRAVCANERRNQNHWAPNIGSSANDLEHTNQVQEDPNIKIGDVSFCGSHPDNSPKRFLAWVIRASICIVATTTLTGRKSLVMCLNPANHPTAWWYLEEVKHHSFFAIIDHSQSCHVWLYDHLSSFFKISVLWLS